MSNATIAAPAGFHVLIGSNGDRIGPATPAHTWQRFAALYGNGYRWAEATDAEVAEYHAENARIAKDYA